MGTIDEGYIDNNNVNEQSSAVINRTKHTAMIPSSAQNHNLTTSTRVKGNYLQKIRTGYSIILLTLKLLNLNENDRKMATILMSLNFRRNFKSPQVRIQ